MSKCLFSFSLSKIPSLFIPDLLKKLLGYLLRLGFDTACLDASMPHTIMSLGHGKSESEEVGYRPPRYTISRYAVSRHVTLNP